MGIRRWARGCQVLPQTHVGSGLSQRTGDLGRLRLCSRTARPAQSARPGPWRSHAPSSWAPGVRALLEGAGRAAGAPRGRSLLQEAAAVVHHSGDAVAHGSLAAPAQRDERQRQAPGGGERVPNTPGSALTAVQAEPPAGPLGGHLAQRRGPSQAGKAHLGFSAEQKQGRSSEIRGP